MDAWSIYQSRMNVHGNTKRTASSNRTTDRINMRVPENLSYTTVDIYTMAYGFNIESDESQDNKIVQNVSIINSDNLNEKTIISMPGEDIELGSLIFWMDNYWLVTERDANTTLYTKGKLLQCNHLLKWISDDKKIMEQWCVVEDGTKYLSGELEDRNFIVTRGDSRISIQIARNEHTVAFGRERRFLVDDIDSPHKLSYVLSKPLKVGISYNQQGTMKFVLQEVTATEDDNHELGIADYYKFFPRNNTNADANDSQANSQDETENVTEANGKRVWI